MRTSEPGLAPPTLPGYAVSTLVGRGATSVVWAGVEEDTGATVAIKVPDPTAYQVGEVLHQAARETAVLQGVRCEHVLRLRRTLNVPGGGVALVLDLAEGGSLADLVAARGRLSDGEVATIFTALATALASIHDSGVIHGDLAAGNVLFTRDGKPMVADFATARLVGEADPPLVAGTAGFVAPEVARGDIPTEASDAYGLGALAWFALTGRPRRGDAAPDLAEAVGFLGKRMGPVVAPLLASDPQERPGLLVAAGGFYRAATPIPVALLDGTADPAAALTRRIRAQASADVAGDARDKPTGRHAAARRRRLAPPEGYRPRGRTLLAVVLATVALFGVGRAVSLRLHEARPQPLVAATTADPGGASGGTSSTAPEPTQSTPGQLVRSDPRGVLAAIAEARAAALMAADAKALERVETSNGPMLRSDTAALATLAASGQSYAQLSFDVRSAEWVGGDERGALVRAVIDRSAYRLVGPADQSQQHPAQPGASFTYELALVEGEWRLDTIR
ncbi:MAG: serine/threonine-protein kinase [Dermatophilaceae bacterium]